MKINKFAWFLMVSGVGALFLTFAWHNIVFDELQTGLSSHPSNFDSLNVFYYYLFNSTVLLLLGILLYNKRFKLYYFLAIVLGISVTSSLFVFSGDISLSGSLFVYTVILGMGVGLLYGGTIFVPMFLYGVYASAIRGIRYIRSNPVYPIFTTYSAEYQPQIKDLVISIQEEFGFRYNSSLDYDLEDPQKFYRDTGGAFYMLLEDCKVIGTVAIKKVDDETAELKRLYLLPEYRGKGLGSMLTEKALSFCKERNFKKCILDTNTNQPDAQKLYEKNGFKIYRTEDSVVFMEKSLMQL